MEFRILGELEVIAADGPVPLPRAKQRALLTALLLTANRVVPDEVLIDELWGGAPPKTAANNLQVLVSQLRRALGAERLVRRAGGYMLVVQAGELDRDVFEALAAEGAGALARGDPATAAETLGRALELWRGAALVDLAYAELAQPEIARLEELRLSAQENRVDARLALGGHRELVPELEALVEKHPFRERLRGQLMLALYRSGRQAEALAAYRAARTAFVDQLGIEPSRDLRRLEQAVLRQEESLAAPEPLAPARGRRRAPLGLLTAAVAAALAGLGAAELAQRGEHAVKVVPSSLAAIDPGSNRIVDDLRLGTEPALVAAGGDSVWVGAAETNALMRVDARTSRVTGTFGVDLGPPHGLAADEQGAWVASSGHRTTTLQYFTPSSETATRQVELSLLPAIFNDEERRPIALGGGALWVSNGATSVARVAPGSGRKLWEMLVDDGAGPIAWGAGDVWTAYSVTDTVSRIDDRTGRSLSIQLARSTSPQSRIGVGLRGAYDPSALVAAYGAIWVAAYGVDAVVRIDPGLNAIVETIHVGDGPHAIAAGAGSIWVANRLGDTVTRIDPRRNKVAATIRLGGTPEAIVVAHGRVWVTIRAG
jgi:YVTN family beta-propeller protein